MEIIYLLRAKNDLDFWIASGNKPILRKIAELTKAILEVPYMGIGKPEQLKYDYSGLWSRRITGEHRYVYTIRDEMLIVFSLRGHY